MSVTSPHWSTEVFAQALTDVDPDVLRMGAQIYRDAAPKFEAEIEPILYALAEAIDYIAFLRDTTR